MNITQLVSSLALCVGLAFVAGCGGGGGGSGSTTVTPPISITGEGKAWSAAVMLSSGDVLRTAMGPQVSIDTAGNALAVWQ